MMIVRSFKTTADIIVDSTVYPAHIRSYNNGFLVQTVDEHLSSSATYARKTLERIGLGNTAYLCGLIHDIGKYTNHYKDYIVRSACGEDVRRGAVNHTFAGVKYILDEFHAHRDPFIRMTAEFVAYAIGAHHGEFDCVDTDGKFGFTYRMTKNDPDIDEAVEYFRNTAGKERMDEIQSLIALAADELKAHLNPNQYDGKSRPFSSGLLARLLLSAVIEGDRRDTAEFMRGECIKNKEEDHFSKALAYMEAYLTSFKRDTEINQCRGKISDLCVKAGDMVSYDCGSVYRLDIPTGGGKTLSSLRYALHSAVRSGKKRIIYVIPLLSILEQNATEIKKAIGNDDIVFEHHSNVIVPEDCNELEKNELLADTWDSPILITTLVQFLNTLFSHKTTSIRRFHSLAESIIILDEVQTVPLKMLSLFNSAIDFLTKTCGTDIILCSATQPAFELASKPIRKPIREIVPFDKELWKPFDRTKFQYYDAPMDVDSISEFAYHAAENSESLLIVCNTKNVAARLYNKLKDYDGDVYYLSTNLCMEHRRRVLSNVKKSLDDKRKTICVSTQVIEAGVDISFRRVIRMLAGLDSLVQAAGRCNRNGEKHELSEVSIIRCTDESLKMLPDIENGQKAVLRILKENKNDPSELTLNETIREYYRILYKDIGLPDDFQDYYSKECGDTLYSMLSKNQKFWQETKYVLNQAFLSAGTCFKVFDTETYDIAVPYGEGDKIIAELYSERAKNDFTYQKELTEKIKPYTVSIYSYQKDKFLQNGALNISPAGIMTLSSEWYGEEGLLSEQNLKFEFMEV